MPIYKFLIHTRTNDPRIKSYLTAVQMLGIQPLHSLIVQDLYFIEGQLSQEELQQLALKLLCDPVTQTASWIELPSALPNPEDDSVILEVALRPGVTDPVAEQIVRSAHELNLDGVHRAATGQRFVLCFDGSVDPLSASKSLAKSLLANSIIQRWVIGGITPAFPQDAASSGTVEILPLRNRSHDQLLDLSKARRAALDLTEMQAIQAYFEQEGCDPSDVEFETIAQTWSEHCVHKTFKARIDIRGSNSEYPSSNIESIDSLIRTYLKSATDKINAPWVISAFVDNAGIMDFDDESEI